MAVIDKLLVATLNKNEEDAGLPTGSWVNLTINIGGEDAVDTNFRVDKNQGHGEISDYQPSFIPFESSALTNCSVRVSLGHGNGWGPQHILVLGRTTPPRSQFIPLAVEVDIERWLNASFGGSGHISMPIRLVGLGSSSTLIRRVLLLVRTGTGDEVWTDNPIEIEITAGGNIVLKQEIHDSPQADLEEASGNWYPLDASIPFTKGDVLLNGEIRMRILGSDAWTPMMVFVYGFDTAEGRPNEIVHLVSIPQWTLGTLSTDPGEGEPFFPLPVI